MLASVVPNAITKKYAEKLDLAHSRLWLGVCLVFAAAFLVVRVFEYPALNCRWDTNAYGSVVWVLLSLHTVHLLTDFVDSAVLEVVLFYKPTTEAVRRRQRERDVLVLRGVLRGSRFMSSSTSGPISSSPAVARDAEQLRRSCVTCVYGRGLLLLWIGVLGRARSSGPAISRRRTGSCTTRATRTTWCRSISRRWWPWPSAWCRS